MAFFFLSKSFLRYAKKSRPERAVGRAREEARQRAREGAGGREGQRGALGRPKSPAPSRVPTLGFGYLPYKGPILVPEEPVPVPGPVVGA